MDPVDKKHPPRLRAQKFPSLERLHVLFEYNPEAGTLHHKLSGESAGTPNMRGYLYVSVDGVKYLVHHIAWCLHYNKAPRLGTPQSRHSEVELP